jgi:hypothetical protein
MRPPDNQRGLSHGLNGLPEAHGVADTVRDAHIDRAHHIDRDDQAA